MKNKKTPLVSILMPVYNSSDYSRSANSYFLPGAIESLLAQEYRNFELLILDNQSTDNTFEVCKKYADLDSRIVLRRDTRKRFPEEALNYLLSFAKGEYVFFANDDDLWSPKFLHKMVETINLNKELDMVYSNGRSIDVEGKTGGILVSPGYQYDNISSPQSNFAFYLLRRNVIPIIFGLYSKKFLSKIFPFKKFDDLKADVDNLFILKFFLFGGQCSFVDEELFYYRMKPRKLDNRIIGLPNLNDSFNLWLFYVKHQISFLEVIEELINKHEDNFNKRVLLHIFCLNGYVEKTYGLLDWISAEYMSSSKDKKIYELIHKRYLKFVRPMNITVDKVDRWNNDQSSPIRLNFSVLVKYLEEIKVQLNELSISIRDLVLIKSTNSLKKQSLNDIGQQLKIIEKYIDDLSRQNLLIAPRKHDIKSFLKPKVSVITPSLNLSKYIKTTIESISSQKNVEYEHIVVDGGSTDGSLEILKHYPHIKLICKKKLNYNDSFLLGLSKAKGKYIINCSVSDGFMDNKWFSKCVEILDKHRDISLVWGFPQYVDERNKLGPVSYSQFYLRRPPQGTDYFYYWLMSGFILPEGNFCIRKEVFEKCISYSDVKSGGSDFWMEVNYNFNRLGYLPFNLDSVANYGRTHKNQRSEMEKNNGVANRWNKSYSSKVRKLQLELILGNNHQFLDGFSKPVLPGFSYKKMLKIHFDYLLQRAYIVCTNYFGFQQFIDKTFMIFRSHLNS